MRLGSQSCLVFAQDVCVTWVSSFPFWEIAATAVITAAVTFVTIWWSVKAASAQTTRTLAHAAERDRVAREAAIQDHHRSQRQSLVAQTDRAAQLLLESVRRSKLGSEFRAAATAEWSTLRVLYGASDVPDAERVFSYADMAIRPAIGFRGASLRFHAPDPGMLERMRDRLGQWAKTGELWPTFDREMEELEQLAEAAERDVWIEGSYVGPPE